MLKEKNVQIEKSVIEICTVRSKHILLMREASIALRKAKLKITMSPIRFPSEDKLKDLEDELKNRISEFEMSIAKMLKPIVAVHGIHLDHKFWFSSDEIRVGYILLRKSDSLGATHVLFLRDYEDSFDGTKVKEGEVRQYKHVNHFLERLDAADDVLKKAQSKSKKNEKDS